MNQMTEALKKKKKKKEFIFSIYFFTTSDMLLHESEEVQVSGAPTYRQGIFEDRRGSPCYSPYT